MIQLTGFHLEMNQMQDKGLANRIQYAQAAGPATDAAPAKAEAQAREVQSQPDKSKTKQAIDGIVDDFNAAEKAGKAKPTLFKEFEPRCLDAIKAADQAYDTTSADVLKDYGALKPKLKESHDAVTAAKTTAVADLKTVPESDRKDMLKAANEYIKFDENAKAKTDATATLTQAGFTTEQADKLGEAYGAMGSARHNPNSTKDDLAAAEDAVAKAEKPFLDKFATMPQDQQDKLRGAVDNYLHAPADTSDAHKQALIAKLQQTPGLVPALDGFISAVAADASLQKQVTPLRQKMEQVTVDKASAYKIYGQLLEQSGQQAKAKSYLDTSSQLQLMMMFGDIMPKDPNEKPHK
jgi:hypothetical protein